MTLVPVDTSSAVAVSDYLANARTWLATAVEMTGPAEIATAKAEIATAAEATKQLGLSKEIQQDAQEMVRRAEYALGKAIRKGQDNGTVETLHDARVRANLLSRDLHPDENRVQKQPLAALATRDDLYGNGAGIAHLSDDVTAEVFDSAIAKAKSEGNVSRANVVRKINQVDGPQTREQRADLILDLAIQGFTSRQMPARVGVSEETVRQIARDFGIEIPADRSVNRTRRIDSTRIVTQTATALEGLVMGLDLIDFASLDPQEVGQWIDSLAESTRALNRFNNKLKESIQ